MTSAPRFAALWMAAVACAAVLAGCSGGADEGPVEVEVAPGQVVTVSEAPKPTHGIVTGIVGDDALYPLPGATVWILSANLSATTDANGRFAIVNVPVGIYILEGEKKDHSTVQTTVEVAPGETARAVLLLARLPPTDPYHSTFHREAFVEFTAGGFVLSGNSTPLDFERDPSRAVTLVIESAWDGIIQSTESEPLKYEIQELGLRSIVGGRAANPFSMHLDARILPPDHSQYMFSVQPETLETTVMAESHGDLFVTIFYNEAAPAGWSVLNGDA
jgi:hypothetical protein